MKDLLNINLPKMPVVTGTTVAEIEANKNATLTRMEEEHNAKMKAIQECHEENMKTLDKFQATVQTTIQEASDNNDMNAILELMKKQNEFLKSNLF